ncbi:MAG: DNA-directed RNA polymerase subunit omega [Candidatus Omnitrophica bacterium]|nr:DNA-directed RNA polymerase subunit omega [Candidatus Omnitrophota bacterium]
MIDIPIEDLLSRTGSIFKLTILASQRTAQLISGSKPRVEVPRTAKLSVVALTEIAAGKVEFKLRGE